MGLSSASMRIVKRIYVERRRIMYEGQGREMEQLVAENASAAGGTGAGSEWESEAVDNGSKLTTAIAARRMWKDEVRRSRS